MRKKEKDIVLYGLADGGEAEYKTDGNEWKDRRFSKDNGYSFWRTVSAVRFFPNGNELPKDITAIDCGYMYRCASILQSGTNMLVRHYHGYDKPMSTEKLADYLGISVRRCYAFTKRMCDRGIMKREKGKLYINPLYFIRGRYLTWQLYTLFQKDLDSMLPQWVVGRFNGDDSA